MGMMPDNIMAGVDKALAISISLNNKLERKCANQRKQRDLHIGQAAAVSL